MITVIVCIYVIKKIKINTLRQKVKFLLNVRRNFTSSTINTEILIFPCETVFRIHFILYNDYTKNICDMTQDYLYVYLIMNFNIFELMNYHFFKIANTQPLKFG